MKFFKLQALILGVIAFSANLCAETDSGYYDKHFYSKIPWAESHKKEFKELLNHQIITPYTTLHREKTVLLVIDTQNDRENPEGSAPETDIERVVPNIIKTIDT